MNTIKLRGHKQNVRRQSDALDAWEHGVVIPPQPNAPHVPCPKCGVRQWARDEVGYTCLTCGKEVFTVSDKTILKCWPYNNGIRAVLMGEEEMPKWNERF